MCVQCVYNVCLVCGCSDIFLEERQRQEDQMRFENRRIQTMSWGEWGRGREGEGGGGRGRSGRKGWVGDGWWEMGGSGVGEGEEGGQVWNECGWEVGTGEGWGWKLGETGVGEKRFYIYF